MDRSPKNLARELGDALTRHLWSNWTALGVSGNFAPPRGHIIDPEALLLLTCSFGRRDQRLFDEVVDWLTVNWELVNVGRVKNIMERYPWSGVEVMRSLASWLIVHQKKTAKWRSLASSRDAGKEAATPFFIDGDGRGTPVFGDLDPVFSKHGFSRGAIVPRGKSQTFRNDAPACLLLSLRSFFGTNVRAEIVAYLLTRPEGGHPTKIAKSIGYSQKTAQNALTAMKKSRWVKCRETGFEKIYSLTPDIAKAFLGDGGGVPTWTNLGAIYCMMEKVWETLAGAGFAALSSSARAIELRNAITPLVKDVEHPWFVECLANDIKGESFINALMDDVFQFLQLLG